MTHLSLAMIVKNEAETLPHCLRSVQGLVDEIVIVDTGSSDGTVNLAHTFGAKVVHEPWRDDFSAARNTSLAHCTGDWVLVLDADEEVDAASFGEFRRITGTSTPPALRLTIRNYLTSGLFTTVDFAPHPNTSSHPRALEFQHQVDFKALRLFRRLPGIAYAGRIHELVDEAFESRGLPIGNTEALLHHFGKVMPEREDHKRTYYLDLAKRDAREHPGRKQAHFNLLQQAINAHDWEAALGAAQAYRDLSPTGPSLVLFGGGVALQSLGRQGEALAWFQSLLSSHADHAPGRTRQAVSLALLGRHDEARRAFELAVLHGSHFTLAWVNYAEWALQNRAPEEARSILERGLTANPRELSLWSALVDLGVRQERLDLAARDAARALGVHAQGGGGLWHRLVALYLWQGQRLDQARHILRLGRQAFPQDPDLRSLAEKLALPEDGPEFVQ